MASKYEMEDEDELSDGLLDIIKSLALKPFHIILSRTARQAYLTTFLLTTTSILLIGLAIAAYTLFYWSYIPRIGFERTIYLQFDYVDSPTERRHSGDWRNAHLYPHGTISLAPDIVGVQQYDIAIELVMPRTPSNIEAGNFMLEINLYAPQERGSSIMETVQAGISPSSVEPTVLASSRRPTILPYRSSLIELAYKFSELHWYLLNFRQESEKLRVSMFEGVEFSKGWRNVPSTMRFEIQSTHSLQIYAAKAVFRARFKGLKWLMYNYRVISALIFISGFWATEMIFAGLALLALSVAVSPTPQEVKAEEVHEVAEKIKQEPADDSTQGTPKLSETERVFPTLTSQQPLKYSSPPIKQEYDESAAPLFGEAGAPAAEADDEDDDAEFPDSGLGTSLESSSTRRESIRRRTGRLGSKEEG